MAGQRDPNQPAGTLPLSARDALLARGAVISLLKIAEQADSAGLAHILETAAEAIRATTLPGPTAPAPPPPARRRTRARRAAPPSR